MALISKIALGAALAILSLGVFPDRLRGGIIAIATIVAAAFILHFAAPLKLAGSTDGPPAVGSVSG
jgi:ABC-type branched-subunit amino acid transport system permease subunit